MRVNDLIVESEQLDELTAADVGRGVGKVAKGAGAVAGGVAGAWDAAKKGFQSGRATVAGEPDPNAAPTTAQDINAAGPTGTAPAKTVAGAAGAAIQKTAQALTGKSPQQTSQAIYAQIKSQINQLDDKGKKQIMQLLQKSMAQKPAAAPAQPAAQAQPAEPAAEPTQAAQQPAAEPAAQPAQQAAPAAAPAAEPAPQQQAGGQLTPQQIAAKKAELKNRRAGGTSTGTTASGFKQYTKDASSQRIVGANPDGSPKIQQIKASKINLGNNLSEALAQKVEMNKRKMFESSLASGKTSIFKK